ncbi:odorant receptor 43a-like [Pieris brassicae]|uniref:odorant receptor 43a-like n=1 Tax=Pieris brassicae TaxID=7116 RepID=UPI001E660878|nr:odorant receptor 43a-like [Pieris brassicae]
MITNTDMFLGRPRFILHYLGIWLPPEEYKLLRNIYKFLVMFTQFSFIFLEFIYIAVVWGNIDKVSEASYLLFTQASVCYKTTVFMMNKNNLKKLIKFMEVGIFAPQTIGHEKILAAQARKIRNLSAVFLTSAITTCTLWALMPLFDTAETRFFPFKIWMPINTEKSPHYEIGYLYQVISIYISALLFCAVDSSTLSMIMFGCAELEIIIDKIQKIRDIPISRINESDCRKRLTENNKLFNECVRHHQCVVKFIELVEDTYHANIFFQLSGSVGIICIIGLRIVITEPSSVQFYSMLNYMLTILSQLFLYCWCGNELTSMSQNLREFLYLCPWYDQNIQFRRSLIIAMERMKRPIIFKAGRYIPLSRPTFISILRSSYSYFAVLNQTKN